MIETLLKDMSKTVKRLLSNPQILDKLSPQDLEKLRDRVASYEPKSQVGKDLQAQCMDLVGRKLSGPAETKDPDFNRSTTVMNIRVFQPSLTKCIDSHEFVQNVKDPSNQIIVGEVEPETDYSRHKVVQSLFSKEFTGPLLSQRLKFFSWLKERSYTRLVENHDYIVPTSLVDEVLDKIDELERTRDQLLDEFEAQYDEAKAEAKQRLGVHYDEDRYPHFSEIRKSFSVRCRIRPFDPSALLKEVSVRALERERAEAKVEVENTFQEIREALRGGFVDLVESFASSLGYDENGKPKSFHSSKVDKIKVFLQTFEARDLTKDDELSLLAQQARELIENVDPAIVRKDKDLRKNLEESFTKIKDEASKLVVAKARKLDLDD